MAIKQILSNETPNDKGFIVLSDGIDWSRYRGYNPLLLEHDWSSLPIGNVVNIAREGDNWVGNLTFNLKTEKSKELKDLYESGTMKAVSIGGSASIVEDEDTGLKFCTHFLVYEISLVTLPSNPDALSDVSNGNVFLSATFEPTKGIENIVTLSAAQNNLITKYKSRMETPNQDPKVEPAVVEDTQTLATEDTQAVTAAPATQPEAEETPIEPKSFLSALANALGITPTKAPAPAVIEAPDPATEETQTLGAVKENETVQEPKILNAKQVQLTATIKPNMNTFQFLKTDEGRIKYSHSAQLSALRQEDVARPETATMFDSARELVNVMANDSSMKAMLSVTYITDERTGVKENAWKKVEKMRATLNSGANSANFITNTPDLAAIDFLPLIFLKLYPEDSWVSRVARVGQSADKVGMIWVNSAASPAIYFGARAPIAASNYFYDDTPIGMVTKVFSVQPIVWQTSNMDLLNYDALTLGMSESMRKAMFYIHNYWLQRAAEVAADKVPTTGSTIIAAGASTFPLNSSATGNLKQLTVDDVCSLQSAFINRNYTMANGEAILIMPTYYSQPLQTNQLVNNRLIRNAGNELTPMFAQYAGFNMYTRPYVAGYKTSTSTIVDTQKYTDGLVSADGSISSYTSPVLTADTYDIALGMIPEDFMTGIGEINVHQRIDPANYGIQYSTDIRTGATAGRSGGVGIGYIYPAVQA